MTPTHQSRIGSITKLITAAMVLDVAAQHGVGLDDPLPSTLLSLREPITLRGLLTHTSGLRDRDETTRLRLGPYWRLGIDDERQRPGPHHYANLNYIVLGVWLEQISGRPLEVLLDERAGFEAVRALVQFDPARVQEPGCGHTDPDAWKPLSIDIEPPLPSWVRPAGGAIASAEQLARLPAALTKTGHVDAMFRETVATDDVSARAGLGVRVIDRANEPILAHAGATRGHWAEVQWSPRRGVAVAVVASTPQPFKATLFALFTAAVATNPTNLGTEGSTTKTP